MHLGVDLIKEYPTKDLCLETEFSDSSGKLTLAKLEPKKANYPPKGWYLARAWSHSQ